MGRVVDSAGAPVSGESVVATPEQGGPSGSGRSDERGHFELLGLAPGPYRVAAASTPDKALVVEVTDRSAAQPIVIERGAMAALLVRLPHTDGGAVAGAWQVYAQSGRVVPAQREGAAYAFRSLLAGAQRIVAYDGVNAPVESAVELRDGERKEITLLVPRHAGVLRGRVLDEQGEPVADAWVSAHAERVAPGGPPRSVLTGVDGAFELEGIAGAGRYTVRAQSAVFGAGSQSGVEPGSQVTIRLRAVEPTAADSAR